MKRIGKNETTEMAPVKKCFVGLETALYLLFLALDAFSAGGDGNTLLISPFSGEQEQKNHETDFREGVHQRSAKGIVRHQEGRQLPALQ